MNQFKQSLKLTAATFEYSFLVSYSYLKRGGYVFIGGSSKLAKPAAKSFAGFWGNFINSVKRCRIPKKENQQERYLLLEQKLIEMDNRMAVLEKFGVKAPPPPEPKEKKKPVTQDKRMLLQSILQENIMLKKSKT
ncbi:MAG: hypothetical protein HQK75_16100 [Candidatus Magnetomorum sp.]|nr:hypothetical protein [Candidatus Magnetomorum sp.]